jgi:hypothetical protein
MLKNARRAGLLVVSLALVYMANGCAILQRGPSDEEMLKDLLGTYVTSLEEGSVEKHLTVYSKDFEGANGESYDGMAQNLEELMPMLQDWGMEISTEETEIAIDGDKAEIGPIVFEFSQGGVQITLSTTKGDDGRWLITGSEMEQ